MNNQMVFWLKKHTDTLIEQTKTIPQETLEFKMNKQMETFSFNPPINLFEEGEWLLPVTCFGTTNSVFITNDKNNNFSCTKPGHWNSKSGEKFLRNWKNYQTLDLKMILIYMLSKSEKNFNNWLFSIQLWYF